MKQLDTNKFINLALNVLKENPNNAMSVREIWSYAIEKDWIKELGTNAKEPVQNLAAEMYMDHKNLFERIGSNPTKFVQKGTITNYESLEDNIETPATKTKREYNAEERKLHPKLAKFIYTKFLAYPKTIYHESSDKKRRGEGKWLHPDMVAVKFPFVSWNNRELTTELSKELDCFPLKFLSFELKLELKYGTEDFKENFFQAVSNSTWANEGYIVAPDIDEDDPLFLSELQRLSTLYGIGVIKLDIEDPTNSKILFSACTKENIDLSTVDKLSKKNPDFASFIKQVIADCNKKDFKVDTAFYDKEIE